MNDPYLTQTDLNEKSQNIYEIWDITLNEIWEILKRNMSEEDMSILTKEQLDWIAMKKASMKEAEKEVEGGSMYGVVVIPGIVNAPADNQDLGNDWQF